MPLFLILLSVPIIEIALFVTVGEQIGLLWTLTIVLLTAVIGATALRSQGFAVLRRAQSLSRPEDISDVLIDGLFLMAAGLLLLTPGFMTDTIGFILLIPAVRHAIARRVGRHAVKRFVFTGGAQGPHHAPQGDPLAAAREQARRQAEREAQARAANSNTPGRGGASDSPWAAPAEPHPDRDDAEEAVVLDETPPSTRRDDDRR